MKQNKIILGFAILIMFNSCSKLEEKVYNQVPVDEFGNTNEQVDALIGPIYSTLKRMDMAGDISIASLNAQSSATAIVPLRKGGDWWDGGNYKEATMQKWTPLSNEYDGNYNNTVGAIALCNQIYYQVNQNPIITDKDKEVILAEIRGVRAFWYYILCDNYGNVPIVTDFLDKAQPATKSRKEVYNFVISELNDIKDKLRRDVATPSSYGKMTRGGAYMILAKMYLNAEVWNPEGGPKWKECIEACDSIMAMPYILENNWKTNFIPHNEVSKEAILSAVFKSGGTGHQFNVSTFTLHYLDFIALGLNRRGNNGISAMPGFVKTFDTTDIRYRGSFLIGPMIDPATGTVIMTAHNRPLIHTVDITMHDPDSDGWGWVNQEDGARCYKWDFEPGLSTSMENDVHIFRLADVYLMKAEAILRSGGDNGTATMLVNRIRARAFSDPSKLLSGVTLDDIYKERGFELAWEGYNRQDRIRFGTFLLPNEFKPYTSDSKYLLFAIPQTAIDANNKLVQNPGF